MAISNSTQKPLIVALGDPKYVGQDYLEEFKRDHDFAVLPATNRAEVIEQLPKFIAANRPIDAFVIRMGTPPYEPFDEGLLKGLLPSCRIITSASAGYNEFDVEWMTRSGVWFCNTVNAVAEATADMAVFLVLAVLRNTSLGEKGVRTGTWKTGLVPSRDPRGLTLGIVGCGAIGKYTARKAAVFGMRVAYHNRTRLSEEVEKEYGLVYYGTLHELLGAADVVSVSCPLNQKTTGLIGREEFKAMKDGSFLVNTARGPVVDEEALIEALESGKVARAGLDVFANEPSPNPYFKTSDKVVVQPHMGGLTDLAFQKSERECFENIRALFKTGRPVAPVNEISVTKL
ncbi:uncharacterized protein HMPREF1541_03278 [Cyphellophora europaea CBS 101466]|uniref:Glycerate-and formate-dehydrogenase n=1 Tax=Cyphellophora europaea (strain CBS 101466) TaxID=1220924 RepID=W2RZX1_CYPE1|nr:uncharacterized protein HMPREF1541_03278 [Cyphellophora europaea CBS 101466]ETN41343.1 hypothetical protein HMPREF1541_03278 [Cyphellophora europaea CBS 101466]